MEIEMSPGDEEPDEVNDCTGVLKLADNVKVYSGQFTASSLANVRDDDRANITLLIAHCRVKFTQQHHLVKSYLSTHRVIHCGEELVTYVICIVMPLAVEVGFEQMLEIKLLRMVRIADISVKYKEVYEKVLGQPQPQHQNPSRVPHTELKITLYSTLNKFEPGAFTLTHLKFNYLMPANTVVSNSVPGERGVVKRQRRGIGED